MEFSHASMLMIAKEEVAIALMRGTFGSHIGIVFHTAKEGLQVLHLLFHHKLSADNFPTDNFAAVKASNNGLRVRPEEVGAVCAIPFNRRPAKYGDLGQEPKKMMETLQRICI